MDCNCDHIIDITTANPLFTSSRDLKYKTEQMAAEESELRVMWETMSAYESERWLLHVSKIIDEDFTMRSLIMRRLAAAVRTYSYTGMYIMFLNQRSSFLDEMTSCITNYSTKEFRQ